MLELPRRGHPSHPPKPGAGERQGLQVNLAGWVRGRGGEMGPLLSTQVGASGFISSNSSPHPTENLLPTFGRVNSFLPGSAGAKGQPLRLRAQSLRAASLRAPAAWEPPPPGSGDPGPP